MLIDLEKVWVNGSNNMDGGSKTATLPEIFEAGGSIVERNWKFLQALTLEKVRHSPEHADPDTLPKWLERMWAGIQDFCVNNLIIDPAGNSHFARVQARRPEVSPEASSQTQTAPAQTTITPQNAIAACTDASGNWVAPDPSTLSEGAKKELVSWAYSSPKSRLCLVCGKHLVRVNGKHLETHGLTTQEYREMWNIPEATPLFVPTSQKGLAEQEISEIGKKSLEEHDTHITCLECQKKFRMITEAHLAKHSLDKEAYRKKWRIPQDRKLVAQTHSAHLKEHTKTMNGVRQTKRNQSK